MRMEPFHQPPWSGLARRELLCVARPLVEKEGKPLPHGRGGVVELEIDGVRYVRKILRRGGLMGSFLGEICGGPARLIRAVRLAACAEKAGIAVAHPQLVAWRRIGLGFRLVVVTEHTGGVDLAESHNPEDWRAAARLACQLINSNLYHLDFHPRNIHVTGGGRVLLLDVEDLRRGARLNAASMWRRLGRYLIKHGYWTQKRALWLEGVGELGLNRRHQERQLLLAAAAHLLFHPSKSRSRL